MEPAFRQGERVLLFKTRKVKIGDVIVFSNPGMDCIKRVCAINGDSLFVEGDNKLHSTDSRDYGAVRKEQVIGKVILNY
ncbi:S26 family signal peptidase [Candidatus Woesearchaeota archaeon]|nr:S26 family signal peptidase [Candidatus Woesearchaeota archaeon]